MLMMPSYSASLSLIPQQQLLSLPPAVYPGSPRHAPLSSRPLPLALPSKAAGVPNKLVISELISTHDDASV